MALFLFISLIFLTGFFVVSIFLPGGRSFNLFLLKMSIGFGIGCGLYSFLYFLYILTAGESGSGVIFLDTILFLLLLFLYIRKKPSKSILFNKENGNLPLSLIPLLVFILSIAILISLKNPHGGWDAWMIWNLKARFIFRGGKEWEVLFDLPYWHHPDYPLLIPSLVALGWEYMGMESQLVPIFLGVIFTFLTVTTMISSLSLIKGKEEGFLSGAVLMGTPVFISHGASQYADIPLSFYFLSTFALLSLYERYGNKWFLILSGSMAGFSLWTKNEGILFLLLLILIYHSVSFIFKGMRDGLKRAFMMCIGVLPVCVIPLSFKLWIAPSTEIIFQQPFSEIIGKLLNFSLYPHVFKAFGGRVIDFGGWFINPIPFLIFYILLRGIERDMNIITFSLIILFMFTGFFMIYIISPFDVKWYILTSGNRLLLQLWPCFIFLCFIAVKATPSFHT